VASAALPRSAAGNRSPWLIAVILSIATFMQVLDTTIANVALYHIAGGLGASQDEATWVITSYLVANAIVLPVSGWLATAIGRKRFYMLCVALFTISSVFCALATSLAAMVVARVAQGGSGGGMAPVEQSIFADTFPIEKRAQAFALYGLTIVAAPAIGPVLGGWLTDTFSWHWVFLINVPVCLLSLTLVHFFVDEPPAVREDRRRLLAGGLRIDGIGFALVVLGFGTLQIVLDRFQREDGFSSPFIVAGAAVAVISIVVLVIRESVSPRPVVNVRLFRAPAFAVSNLVMFLVGFMLIGTTQLLPQLAQDLLGYDASTAGLTLGVGGLATLVAMPLAGVITGKLIQPKWLIMISLIGTGWSLVAASRLNLDMAFWNISLARILQVVWLPFLFVPLSAVSYVGVPPDQNNDASALLNLTRNLGGAVGVTFVTSLLQWRTQFHHERLAEHITPYNGYGWGTPLASIARVVQAQAAVMSYLDIFWVLGMMALVIWPLVLLLPRMPRRVAAAA